MARGDIYLPTTSDESATKKPSGRRWLLSGLAILAVLGTMTIGSLNPVSLVLPAHHTAVGDIVDIKNTCAQADPSLPSGYDLSKITQSKERIIQWLSGAIKIPTQMYDEMGPVDQDPRWKTIGQFQDYLEKSFPLVHQNLKKSVHDWALVYEWEGSNTSLKPIFLTAHQDVVPVLESTRSQWEQDPFGGYYDGTKIWGRGASDTKGSLIAIMGAIEHLLEEGEFKPTRTVVLGFGSDEERGGQVGAPAINKYLLDKYGKDSMSLLIDEGSGMINTWGQQFAVPGVAEKGHYDLGISVETLGGHSSVPPPHTGIGLMSLLIAELEAHPHPLVLEKESPMYGFMTCAASYAKDMPKDLKKTVIKTIKGDQKAMKHLPQEIVDTGIPGQPHGPGQGDPIRALMTTTQAADIINGGVKVNALPEVVKAVINHRVNVASDHVELQDRTIKVLMPVVKKYNLTMIGFDGKVVHHGSTSKVVLSEAFGYYTDPAPISPSTIEDPAWRVMTSTARGMWASRPEVSNDGNIVDLADGEDLKFAPFFTTGNTDTRRYWDLTRNIYRFRYFNMAAGAGAHTINEWVIADDVVEFTRWYAAIILAMDQAKDVA